MKITAQEFHTKTGADLARDHTRAEVDAAFDSFGCKSASNKRRTPINAGSLIAIWVAVELRCEQMKTRSVLAASEQLANDIKEAGVMPAKIPDVADVTVNPPPGRDQIRALHLKAASIGKRDAAFQKLLDDKKAEQRHRLEPGDVLIPAIFVGGADVTAWLVLSDRWTPGSFDTEDPRFADGMEVIIQPEKSC